MQVTGLEEKITVVKDLRVGDIFQVQDTNEADYYVIVSGTNINSNMDSNHNPALNLCNNIIHLFNHSKEVIRYTKPLKIQGNK